MRTLLHMHKRKISAGSVRRASKLIETLGKKIVGDTTDYLMSSPANSIRLEEAILDIETKRDEIINRNLIDE